MADNPPTRTTAKPSDLAFDGDDEVKRENPRKTKSLSLKLKLRNAEGNTKRLWWDKKVTQHICERVSEKCCVFVQRSVRVFIRSTCNQDCDIFLWTLF